LVKKCSSSEAVPERRSLAVPEATGGPLCRGCWRRNSCVSEPLTVDEVPRHVTLTAAASGSKPDGAQRHRHGIAARAARAARSFGRGELRTARPAGPSPGRGGSGQRGFPGLPTRPLLRAQIAQECTLRHAGPSHHRNRIAAQGTAQPAAGRRAAEHRLVHGVPDPASPSHGRPPPLVA